MSYAVIGVHRAACRWTARNGVGAGRWLSCDTAIDSRTYADDEKARKAIVG